jgi:hypothetical protein
MSRTSAAISAKDSAGKRRISASELLFDLLPDALEVLEICAPYDKDNARPASETTGRVLGKRNLSVWNDCSSA